MGKVMFDPYNQNVTFLAANGITQIHVPISFINAQNDLTAVTTLSYATQLGACIVMLAVVLVMTPTAKLGRPSNVLNILGLIVGIIRMLLLSLYFISPFRHFYQFYASDFRLVANKYYMESNASTICSLVLLLITQAALMSQAWTMVKLWPKVAKYVVSSVSGLIAITTFASKLTLTIIQFQAVSSTTPAVAFVWLSKMSLVSITLSTCWFCAIFNFKLVHHLVSNRGILPSRRALTPMEVLVMANGILMIIPVIFTVLQWVDFVIFEAGSFALTSVILILPLGTLAAQRVAQSPASANVFTPSGGGSYKPSSKSKSNSNSNSNSHGSGGRSKSLASSSVKFKSPDYSTGGSVSATMTSASAGSPSTRADMSFHSTRSCEEGNAPPAWRRQLDPVDLELRQIDGYDNPAEYRLI